MTDPRYRDLAELLVGYSTGITQGEAVLLDVEDQVAQFAGAVEAVPVFENFCRWVFGDQLARTMDPF